MANVTEIAHSSPRLEALIFGPGDYSASQGVEIAAIGAANSTYPGDVWHYARNQIIVAARAAGLAMIDGLFAGITDPDGYRRESPVIPVDGDRPKCVIVGSLSVVLAGSFGLKIESQVWGRLAGSSPAWAARSRATTRGRSTATGLA